MSNPSPYIRPGTIRHASAKLGVSDPTTYKLINSGKLRVYRVGRAVRVTDEAIADCIRQLESEAQVRVASQGRAS